MLRLPAFAHHSPTSIDEAVGLLVEHGPDAVVVAGGTDLYPALKRREATAEVVVGLGAIDELHGIRHRDGGGVAVGALTTLVEVSMTGALPVALRRAARQVSSPQIRNVATIGGNLLIDTRCFYYNQPEGTRTAMEPCLKAGGDTCWVAPGGDVCWAVSSSDLAPVAVALDAEVRFVGPHGERMVPVSQLYTGDGLRPVGRGPDEILVDVLLPPLDGWRTQYVKVARRGTIDFPILGVAVGVRTDDEGVCTEARVVLGAVGPAPLRATEAEQVLVGSVLDDEVIAEAGQAAARPARPLDNVDLPHYYRKWSIPAAVSRALAAVG